MSNKEIDTSSSVRPAKADDLKRITGIGTAFEKRLNDFGIFTFPRLAALSPADIAAAVAGKGSLTSERIIKEDWIGQARKLISGSISREAEEDVEVPKDHAHSVTPSNEGPRVVAELETSTPIVEVIEPVPPPVVAITEPTGVLRLSQIETVLAGSYMPQNFFTHDQLFNIHLTLDLRNVRIPADTEFRYRTTIYSKSLEGHPGQVVGETSGIVTSTDRITVSVEGIALPKGTYRLKAILILNPMTTEPVQQPGLVASNESDLLQIF